MANWQAGLWSGKLSLFPPEPKGENFQTFLGHSSWPMFANARQSGDFLFLTKEKITLVVRFLRDGFQDQYREALLAL